MEVTQNINPVNPLLRLRSSARITQEYLGGKCGISKQYISKAERGMFKNLSAQYLTALTEDTDKTVTEVLAEYEEWQDFHRRETVASIDPAPVASFSKNESQPRYIVFKRWRERYWYSKYDFGVGMCIRGHDVFKYEKGIMQMMPTFVKEVLEPFGLLEGFDPHRR